MAKLIDQVDELKKRLIIDTANKYFKISGYEKTQIDKISKELGIGVGTIYGYFKNKEGLFLAWLSSVIQNAYEEMKLTCDEVSSPVEKLEKMAEYKIKYFERNKTTIKAYMENNQLFLRGISRRKEHPMACVYAYSASIIREIKKMSEDLQQTMYAISSAAYSQVQQEEQQAQGGAENNQQQAGGSSNNSDDDVIDAEYTKE